MVVYVMTAVVAQDFFHDYKIDRLGGSVEMHCNNTSEQSMERPNNSIPVSWMLRNPKLKIIDTSIERFELTNDMWTLVVSDIVQADLGQYHCMLMDEDQNYYLVTVGINVKGPYFTNMWDKYWMNTIIAFASMIGFLLLACLAFILYRHRYIPEVINVSPVITQICNPVDADNVDGIPMKTMNIDTNSSSVESTSSSKSDEKALLPGDGEKGEISAYCISGEVNEGFQKEKEDQALPKYINITDIPVQKESQENESDNSKVSDKERANSDDEDDNSPTSL